MKPCRARAEIQPLAIIGLSRALRSEACSTLGASDEVRQRAGGDPADCSHRAEQLTAFRGLPSARRSSSSLPP